MLIESERWFLSIPADVLSDRGSPFRPKISSRATVSLTILFHKMTAVGATAVEVTAVVGVTAVRNDPKF